jgi:hypothetical protein
MAVLKSGRAFSRVLFSRAEVFASSPPQHLVNTLFKVLLLLLLPLLLGACATKRAAPVMPRAPMNLISADIQALASTPESMTDTSTHPMEAHQFELGVSTANSTRAVYVQAHMRAGCTVGEGPLPTTSALAQAVRDDAASVILTGSTGNGSFPEDSYRAEPHSAFVIP